MVTKKQEINKLIIDKISQSNSNQSVKDFLISILNFEREFFNEEMERYYSSQYIKYLEKHSKGIRGEDK
ncbi:hypothetical protein HZC31_01815 [Candidatus Woesearchaeota archaeon]|nr:hypothetical protein [Candidatus Woesearchaeota archaeon]